MCSGGGLCTILPSLLPSPQVQYQDTLCFLILVGYLPVWVPRRARDLKGRMWKESEHILWDFETRNTWE